VRRGGTRKRGLSRLLEVGTPGSAPRNPERAYKAIAWVQPGTPIIEIAKTTRDEDDGAIPAGKNDRLVGMVSDRDTVCRGLAAGRDCVSLKVRDVLTTPIVYRRANEDVEDVSRVMEQNRIRRVPVIDEKTRVSAIVSVTCRPKWAANWRAKWSRASPGITPDGGGPGGRMQRAPANGGGTRLCASLQAVSFSSSVGSGSEIRVFSTDSAGACASER
jgi:CBS domain-containing protein